MSRLISPVPSRAVPATASARNSESLSAGSASCTESFTSPASKHDVPHAGPELDSLPQEILDEIVDHIVVPGEDQQQAMGLFLANKHMNQTIRRILPFKNAWAHEVWWKGTAKRKAHVHGRLGITATEVWCEMWTNCPYKFTSGTSSRSAFFQTHWDLLKEVLDVFIALALGKYVSGIVVWEDPRSFKAICSFLVNAQGYAHGRIVRKLIRRLKGRAKEAGTWLSRAELEALLEGQKDGSPRSMIQGNPELFMVLE